MVVLGICDDEKHYRSIIRKYLEEILQSNVQSYEIHEFTSGEELLENYPNNLDILILDIQMDGIDGMNTARRIRTFDSKVEIIFMTSYSEFMQEGYEVRAYRYLLKPIDFDKLNKHIIPCVNELKRRNSNYLTINTKNYIDRIKIDSILYIETQRPNLLIYTNKKVHSLRMSMRKIEGILEEYSFYRCHNSFLVNLKEIESMDGEYIFISDMKIPVSRYRTKGLKLAITNTLGDIVC
ncbi:two-component system response regulator RgaR [Paraclostridium bifermentans]|uniref:LytR/AlgR family response regulator transcription factor n=1 Tax=Paraclostridium bifermentans TaxID=1490 RepID=UPI00189AD269|nr:LytTR family DNA-binding domain-containing protein [Paraclostridium bifermentans]MBU5289900.1 LytTR family DNA-binding domain-containing protein [Paraclostridium bifermentans]